MFDIFTDELTNKTHNQTYFLISTKIIYILYYVHITSHTICVGTDLLDVFDISIHMKFMFAKQKSLLWGINQCIKIAQKLAASKSGLTNSIPRFKRGSH